MTLNGRKITTTKAISLHSKHNALITHFYFPCRCTFKNIFDIVHSVMSWKTVELTNLQGGHSVPSTPSRVVIVIAPGSQPPPPGRPAWQCYLCVWRQVPWLPGRVGCPGRGWLLQSGTCWLGSGPDLRRRWRDILDLDTQHQGWMPSKDQHNFFMCPSILSQ